MGNKILNKEEIKDAVDIVSIINSYLPLQKKGRSYWGLCPFHGEKTSSFSVSPERQYFYCFGCQASGDVIKFIQMKEGLEFSDAVAFLADRAGIKILYDESTDDYDRADHRNRLAEINRKAMLFYQNCLWKTKEGHRCLEYLMERGIKKETILRFSLGYAPDRWDALIKFMVGRICSMEELEEAGLVRRNASRSSCYDLFRKRLIIPIVGAQNKVIAFGARVLTNELPKYVNSPETELFHKSKTLFAMNIARPNIKNAGSAIIVEGYMDVIKMHQAGIDNCVASLGTAFTRDHARLLKFCTENVYVAYDGDAAGQNATVKGIRILEEEKLNVHILEMPDGVDPDDYIGKYGADEFRKLMSSGKKITAYRLDRLLKNNDGTVTSKKAIRDESFRILADLHDNLEIDYYISYLAENLDVKEFVLRNEFSVFLRRSIDRSGSDRERKNESQDGAERMTPARKTEEELIRYYIDNLLTEDIYNDIEKYITVQEHKAILNALQQEWTLNKKVDKGALLERFDDENTKKLLIKAIFAGDSDLTGELEYKELLDKIKTNSIDVRINILKREMSCSDNTVEADRILQNIQTLQKEKMSLRNDR